MCHQLIIFLIYLLLNLIHPLFGQKIFKDSILQDLTKSLSFIKNNQYENTQAYSFAGEWPSSMVLDSWFPLLGKSKDYEDANCYTTASIHNCLSNIYLLDKDKNAGLLPVLRLAFNATLTYRDSNTFNFWHKLPTNLPLSKKEALLSSSPVVRRPTTYKLRTRYIRKAANIIDDSDDTAAGYLAILLQDSIFNTANKASLSFIVNNYRDVNRDNFHWLNWMHNDKKNTGAYLTWLGTENKLVPKSIITTFFHNIFFFLPASECYPKRHIPYIPYGTNDVDPVVNANILHFLKVNKELDEAGDEKKAIDFIYSTIERDRFDRATIYYPNRYSLHYAVSRAYAAGVKSLGPSVDLLIDNLKIKQESDGSFESKRNVNNKDLVQSTVYALLTLLYAGNFEKYNTKLNIEKAIRYLHNNRIELGDECHWKGGVFFSGGTVVKHCLFFKSDTYTTALIAESMAIYLDLVNKKKL